MTSVADVFAATGSSLGLIQGWKALTLTFPDMRLDEVLTARGQRLARLAEETQACYAALGTMVADALAADPSEPLTVDDWFGSRWARAWSGMTAVGGKDFAGPLLVLQGDKDEATLEPLTTKYVNLTCERFPESELEYVVAEGVGHIPTMYATQQLWLEWLDERFGHGGGGKGGGGCSRRTIGGRRRCLAGSIRRRATGTCLLRSTPTRCRLSHTQHWKPTVLVLLSSARLRPLWVPTGTRGAPAYNLGYPRRYQIYEYGNFRYPG